MSAICRKSADCLKKEKVSDILRYLGRLRGLSKAEALDRGLELFHRVGLYEHRDKKVEGLSRGMTQFVQFVVTLIHSPDLIPSAYSSAGIVLSRFEQVLPSLNDIFIEEVSNARSHV